MCHNFQALKCSKYKAIPNRCLSPTALNDCLNEVFGEGENVQSLW